MQINGIGAGIGAGATGMESLASGAPGAKAQGGSFMDMLQSITGQLTEVEQNSNQAVERLATGEPIDIHEVVMATEMESLAFQLMLNVRNKLVEGYQEVFRMQV